MLLLGAVTAFVVGFIAALAADLERPRPRIGMAAVIGLLYVVPVLAFRAAEEMRPSFILVLALWPVALFGPVFAAGCYRGFASGARRAG